MNLRTFFAALIALVALGDVWAADMSRLDAALPREATCLIKLGTGPQMRVPRQIVNAVSCDDQRYATPVEQFDMTIQFPQMTMGAWTSAMSRIFAQEGGKDVLHVDEFPVKVIYVFYPEQFKNPTLDTWSGPNPQVWQMKARKLMDSRMKDSKFEPAITEAKVKGLRMMSYAPPGYVSPQGPTGRYGQAHGQLIEPAGASYDLMMTCDATIECQAFVQLKPSLVQSRRRT